MITNYIYNSLYQILRIILPIITMPYVARVLSPDGVGAYSLSASWGNLFMIIGMIGIDSYGTREIAYVRDNMELKRKTFWEINALKMISIGISIAVYSIIIFVIIRPSHLILYVIQLFNIMSSFVDVSWYFSGIENFKSTAIRNIVVKIISTIATFLFVKNENDVWLYALILCFGQFVGQLAMWKEIINELFPIIVPRKRSLIKHFSRTVLLWIPSLAASMYNYLDKIMLGAFTNDYQVGIYDYSQNLVKIPATLIFTVATVTMPHVAADYSKGDNKEVSNIFCKSMNIVTLLAVPMCLGYIAVSKNFVYWFLGDKYSEVSILLKISSWIIIPISWSQIFGNQLLIAKGREKEYSISICCGAAVNICLNAIVVKIFQAKGVLVTSIIAEVVVLLAMMLFAKSDFSLKIIGKSLLRYIAPALIMFICLNIFSKAINIIGIGLTILQIIIGIIIFFICLLIMKNQIVFDFLRAVKKRVVNKHKL